MNNLDRQYTDLLKTILEQGVVKKDRTGTGTKSIFGYTIRHNMADGFPMLTTKKLPFKNITTELLWFLRGETNIKYLVDNGCNIWNGDCYQAYLKEYKKWKEKYINEDGTPFSKGQFIDKIKNDKEFSDRFGNLGPVYGKQWRSWESKGDYKLPDNVFDWVYTESGLPITEYKSKQIDQIQNLINDLKTNPDSRRLMVNAWAVHDLPNMVLPPCHYGFQVYTRELSLEERVKWLQDNKGYDLLVGNLEHDHIREVAENESPTRAVSLMFNMRSNDVPLGLPFNIASYGLLLEIISRMVNMVPDELIANLGDAHIYKNQIDGVKEQLTRGSFSLPNLMIADDVNFNGTIDEFLESCTKDSFKLDGYESHPTIKMPLSN